MSTTQHINWTRRKLYDSFNKSRQKNFDKTKYPFMMKIQQKEGKKGTVPLFWFISCSEARESVLGCHCVPFMSRNYPYLKKISLGYAVLQWGNICTFIYYLHVIKAEMSPKIDYNNNLDTFNTSFFIAEQFLDSLMYSTHNFGILLP